MSHSSSTNNTIELDIFAPPHPTPEDEQIITFKCKAKELHVQLKPMVQSAPADYRPMIDKKGWCDQWTLLRDSLTSCIEKDGQSGHTICERICGQVTAEEAEQECLAAAAEAADEDASDLESVVIPKKRKVMLINSSLHVTNTNTCNTCTKVDHPCYPSDNGNTCAGYKHLKVKCSLASEKGKGKEQPASTTTAPKPWAKLAKGGLAMVSPPPVARPSAPCMPPGPLGIRHLYVEIKVN
ncbi:hypothetical protein CY34DRAFT_14534 [Suillus luteus UH-Slu-Lm8-n1]|uniref:Uncharacterized protein n=1 Tax=Suillus luteus UH-Slu-Lm8-n1 TaxID=930992 RepID=A0A0D0B5S8_9AGAM|nr:hypothetical protein CY34DRAFT_14534 [Suillus luteus UH-Slu-Lm8-n1]